MRPIARRGDRYLCEAANRYFARQIAPADVVWSYSGVRALYDDGAAEAKDVTRDYHLELDRTRAPKLLSVFGGKITTARALAAGGARPARRRRLQFTAHHALPGGDVEPGFNAWTGSELGGWMPGPCSPGSPRAYGTRLKDLIGDAAASPVSAAISAPDSTSRRCAWSWTRNSPAPPTTSCGGGPSSGW